MRVYAKAVRRRDKLSGDHLEAFDAALVWALLGTNGEDAASKPEENKPKYPEETAV